MKTIVPTSMNEMKSSLDSLRTAFSHTFKQLVDKGKELQQVTEQLLVPHLAKNWPRTDIVEGDTELFIILELPGLAREEFQIELGNGLLFLRGEKKNPFQDKASGIHVSECGYGKFERTIPLPVRVVEDKADAQFKDGLLTIVLPKADAATQQRVSVKIR